MATVGYHEITSLCLNEFEKDIRDRVVAFTGTPNLKGVTKNHRVSLLQVFHSCRHTIEVDRVSVRPFFQRHARPQRLADRQPVRQVDLFYRAIPCNISCDNRLFWAERYDR